jgi:hypothetical protein
VWRSFHHRPLECAEFISFLTDQSKTDLITYLGDITAQTGRGQALN